MFRRLLIVFLGIELVFCLQLNASGDDTLIARPQFTGSITERANLLSCQSAHRLQNILASRQARTRAPLTLVTTRCCKLQLNQNILGQAGALSDSEHRLSARSCHKKASVQSDDTKPHPSPTVMIAYNMNPSSL